MAVHVFMSAAFGRALVECCLLDVGKDSFGSYNPWKHSTELCSEQFHDKIREVVCMRPHA